MRGSRATEKNIQNANTHPRAPGRTHSPVLAHL